MVWVKQLIDENFNSRNVRAMEENCTPEEVNNIMAIPVSMFQGDDIFVWHYNKKGTYSVKSGYVKLGKSIGPERIRI